MSFHFVRELPTPAVVKEMHPVPTELAEIKKERDRMISDIISPETIQTNRVQPGKDIKESYRSQILKKRQIC